MIFRSVAFVCASAALLSPALANEWTGKASWYALRGRTASGAHAGGGLTAAHRTLPFGTHLRITNIRNAKSVVVVVNDRGPFVRNRIVDVSLPAAEALGFRHAGIASVRVETVSR